MKKYRLNKERAINALLLLLYVILNIILLLVILNAPESPTEQWHEAYKGGMSWNEYTKENKNV